MLGDIENYTKAIAAVSATVAAIGGGYTLWDKMGFDDPILAWSPEHFSISDGPVDGEFKVIVAREKLRDDCSVEGFRLEVRDSDYIVHPAIPSIAKFSGPANDKVDKFGYKITIDSHHQEKVSKGEATLLAHIDYKCPEGDVVVNYPDHENLKFRID